MFNSWILNFLAVIVIGLMFASAPTLLAPILIELWKKSKQEDIGRKAIEKSRLAFVANYDFPDKAIKNLAIKFPDWGQEKHNLAWHGLREFLMASVMKKGLDMPSVLADEAWHEFLSHESDYKCFCYDAYGEFLGHHKNEGAIPKKIKKGDRIGEKTMKSFSTIKTLYRDEKELVDQARKKDGLSGVAWASLSAMPLLFALDLNTMNGSGWIYDADVLANIEKMAGSGTSGSCSSYTIGASSVDGGSAGGDGGSSCGGGGCGS